MYSKKGQEAVIRSYMYSPLPEYPAPKGAPEFKKLQAKAFPWSQEFVTYVVKNREDIKEQFAQIMFNWAGDGKN